MVKSAVRLQGMGADVLIMPCNTAHYFYDRITPFVDTPFLNMIEETAKVIKANGFKKVGLLATDGTCTFSATGGSLMRNGMEMCTPSPENQQAVMDIIYRGDQGRRSVH